VIDSVLACTVRECGGALARAGRALACERGHSYDIARSGYVNLLQPQDRRSLGAGDSKDVVVARSRLLDDGVGSAVIDAFVELVGGLHAQQSVAVDLGSGSGHALAAVAAGTRINGVGIDISVPAVEHAARSIPDLTWVAANADRRLPLLDGSVSVVLSIHGRRNPEECARVLAPGGHLVVAVPAADDLIELRAAVQGRGVERDRVEALVAEHVSSFDVLGRRTVRARQRLAPDALGDLLTVTYRGARHGQAPAVGRLEGMDVTFASDIVIFVRR
jgi:23S rRNA (guanine745-N1)-methyltransferase